MSGNRLQNLMTVLAILGLFISVFPVIHAARSGDAFATLGTLLLVVAAIVIIVTGGPLGGQMQGIILGPLHRSWVRSLTSPKERASAKKSVSRAFTRWRRKMRQGTSGKRVPRQ